MDKNTPLHIKQIIQDLQENPNKESVLLNYTYLLSKDVSLLQIFLDLGFSLKSNSFTRPILSSHIFSLLSQEYTLQKPTIENYLASSSLSQDNDIEIRQELLKTFYAKNINEITTSTELGLDSPEDLSICQMFQDISSSKSPMFSTPKPNKLNKTPSTQETRYLTPCSLKNYSDESEQDTPRSIRGLKHLTSLIKQIIVKYQPTSFKNVAFKLIEDLIVNEGSDRLKEEKNVRRRVYDAINVLIAAEVLERSGRNVSWKDSWENIEIGMRKDELDKRKKRVEEKRKGLKAVVNKYLAINQLICRNRRVTRQPAIRFPFIVVSTPDVPNNTMTVNVNEKATFLQIKFGKKISLFGDMDLLLKMGMHKMEVKDLLKVLPSKELLPYCE